MAIEEKVKEVAESNPQVLDEERILNLDIINALIEAAIMLDRLAKSSYFYRCLMSDQPELTAQTIFTIASSYLNIAEASRSNAHPSAGPDMTIGLRPEQEAISRSVLGRVINQWHDFHRYFLQTMLVGENRNFLAALFDWLEVFKSGNTSEQGFDTLELTGDSNWPHGCFLYEIR